jgi:hypothetical protein
MYAKGALLVVVVLAVGACTRGARDVDYPPSRGISDDVDAAHQASPLITKGQRQRSEPYDAFPWRFDERRQSTQ